MDNDALARYADDHCRIGSLENLQPLGVTASGDHCRIGSLERSPSPSPVSVSDHCRIGSLEIFCCLLSVSRA